MRASVSSADGIVNVNMNMTRPQCHVSSTASSVFRTQFVSVVVVMMTMFSFSFHSCCRFAKRVFDTNWSELHHSDSFTVAVDSSCSLLHTHVLLYVFCHWLMIFVLHWKLQLQNISTALVVSVMSFCELFQRGCLQVNVECRNRNRNQLDC